MQYRGILAKIAIIWVIFLLGNFPPRFQKIGDFLEGLREKIPDYFSVHRLNLSTSI